MESADVIPAFLKLNIDAYQTIAQVPADAPACMNDWSDTTTAEGGPASDAQAIERLLDPRNSWLPSLAAIGAKGDGAEIFGRLVQAYSEPQRHAHTLQLLADSLSRLRLWQDIPDHPHEIVLALWFRDAVFDPMRHDNKGRSARLAFDTLTAMGVELDVARRIRDLVVVTRQDMPPITQDARLMVDLDMAVLASAPARYQQYEEQLRAEYAHITEFIYKRRRVEALKALLARVRVYHTDTARVELEKQTRANLLGHVARLQNRATAPDVAVQ